MIVVIDGTVKLIQNVMVLILAIMFMMFGIVKAEHRVGKKRSLRAHVQLVDQFRDLRRFINIKRNRFLRIL
ncbi:hypothetical protein E0M25_09345 [Bacillus mycoides]|uniref:hypothetical protein n=1 Tax=Bacillus cereus group TaxID=86661 RepID=UPI00103B26F4|nr:MULTISPECIES: hypothetical protein [Bacillus cereus group]QWG34431.1 hypothetical protein EXW30_16525 [Bacillus mycoides]QWG45819.1 hypothetical protein EXW31_16810 [Bacillus mycoides]QWH12912.1 hypothetical protein EXW38_16850 [Bacillus mycoides]TBX79411.1 hypothetical protein E0M25_09345 [Bacillus mycoides]